MKIERRFYSTRAVIAGAIEPQSETVQVMFTTAPDMVEMRFVDCSGARILCALTADEARTLGDRLQTHAARATVKRMSNPGFEINRAIFGEGEIAIRKARIAHDCTGRPKKVECANNNIARGELYVEYIGESRPYECGKRYCFECAAAQGLGTITGGK